jgi:CheY-like chemotaxis protein
MDDDEPTVDNSDKLILSVDDDPVNQMVISSLFEGEGYQVIQAMDGLEALEAMRTTTQPVDLILLDVMMPNMSGYECLDHLRAEYPPDLPYEYWSSCNNSDLV